MNFESELQNAFTEFLVNEKGYPPVSLRAQLAIADKSGKHVLRPDLVVIDPATNKVAAIIEFKIRLDPRNEASARSQVLAYRNASGIALAPTYVVYPGTAQETQARFTIYEIYDANEWAPVDPHDFPSYETLILGERAQSRVTIAGTVGTTVDRFKLICFALSALVIIALLLDLLAAFSLSTQQLTLLIIAIALILIPYAAKLRFLGIEFERIQDSQDDRTT